MCLIFFLAPVIIDEAFRLMLTIPCKSDADILESLLAACRDCHEIDFQLFVQTFIKIGTR